MPSHFSGILFQSQPMWATIFATSRLQYVQCREKQEKTEIFLHQVYYMDIVQLLLMRTHVIQQFQKPQINCHGNYVENLGYLVWDASSILSRLVRSITQHTVTIEVYFLFILDMANKVFDSIHVLDDYLDFQIPNFKISN